MKYPKEYLDEIKLRLKVSQVVGKTVQLKKRGKEYIGLSPFKNEKSPSFTVSDEKEFYHCFSTGEHGNIFDFLIKTKSMGFGEAVKILAAEAGMAPFRFSNFDEKKEKKFKIYKNICKDYSDFFSTKVTLLSDIIIKAFSTFSIEPPLLPKDFPSSSYVMNPLFCPLTKSLSNDLVINFSGISNIFYNSV